MLLLLNSFHSPTCDPHSNLKHWKCTLKQCVWCHCYANVCYITTGNDIVTMYITSETCYIGTFHIYYLRPRSEEVCSSLTANFLWPNIPGIHVRIVVYVLHGNSINSWSSPHIYLSLPLRMDSPEDFYASEISINDLSVNDTSRDTILAGSQLNAELNLALSQVGQLIIMWCSDWDMVLF